MLLEGKVGLVLGIANKRSLAWGIAQAVSREGARLAVTYQGERLEENVRELAARLRDPVILPCDVGRDEDIEVLMQGVQKELGGLDFVVHAVAYALREELDGEFLNTSREGYRLAQDISSYSLTAVARRAAPLMEGRAGSIVTLTYLGGERVVPHYNVMGVAKAALDMSVRYLAAALTAGRGRVVTSASIERPFAIPLARLRPLLHLDARPRGRSGARLAEPVTRPVARRDGRSPRRGSVRPGEVPGLHHHHREQ